MRSPLLVAAALILLSPLASSTSLPNPHHDAGSGRDAGESLADALPIEAGVTYQGWLLPVPVDAADTYVLTALEGQAYAAVVRGAACYELLDDAGARLRASCDGFIADRSPTAPVDALEGTFPRAGAYYLRVVGGTGVAYEFQVQVE